MTHKEYKEYLSYELYGGGKLNPIQRIRIKYLRPDTNCVYLARKMWYYYSKGGIWIILSKLLYLKIIRRYGCSIYSEAKVGRGFKIGHPTGICIGPAEIGENFTILQNCTVGVKDTLNPGGLPQIGNNVTLCENSSILGDICVADNVLIGAHSLVIKDITESGVYFGVPVNKKRDGKNTD